MTQIDPRGQQFNAAITSVVLAVVLLVAPHPAGVALLAIQTGLFAAAVLVGVQRTPVARLFAKAIAPRLSPACELEDPRPPRFAQGVGLVFAMIGLIGYLAGATTVGAIAVGLALTAALLNAAFRFCLGCEIYLLLKRAGLPLQPKSEQLAN